ncbi:MAG TPA: VOC family protein [Cyclobacteriaceae bacterium]|nr:VOC family protein [Cyclobacteriaceae bacterium]
MNVTQIKETCLYFRDLVLARSFYHDKLGLPIISYVPEKHIFFQAGTSVLLCFNPDDSRLKKSPPPHFGEGKYHFAFEVRADEYQHHKKEVLEKGIRITDLVVWESGQESFYFEDPFGNVLEIVPEGIWIKSPMQR